MAIKESPERAAAARNPSLSHRCNNLVQRSVRLLGNQGKDALAIVLQNRTATAARFRRTHPVITGEGVDLLEKGLGCTLPE
jgi:hypothetical protein